MKRWFRIVLITGLVIGIPLFMGYLEEHDWPAHPDPLPEVVQEAVRENPSLAGEAFVYNFGQWLRNEQLWRIASKPELITLLAQKLGLKEIHPTANVPSQFWQQPPFWWRPDPKHGWQFFVSTKFNAQYRANEGSYWLLGYDETTGILYGWLYNNSF
ncbi:hypothetical protein [Armatimonas sp.]|uniref:hypothetical protein n=1 Tax=Armatimonas sp. TaxID=1872638 RepID=UPI00374FE5E7